MWRYALESGRKLRENDAFGVLLHPAVVANHLLYRHELRQRPLTMRSDPPGIEIELTNRCNLACVQCLRSVGLRPYVLGDITLQRFERILAQFPRTLHLSLNGFGEPLLHGQFFEIVALARRRLPWAKIGIYSNGMLLGEAARERMLDGGLTELNVSIDAARPETYAKVRRGGHLEIVHDNLRRLLSRRRERGVRLPVVGVNFVMVNENEGELAQFIEQAADLGVDFVNTVTYAAYDWGFRNARTPGSYRRDIDAAKRRADALGVRCRSWPPQDISWADPSAPFRCAFFWGEQFRITYEGTITLGCCTPFREMFAYGNVLETPFREIWNGERFRRNRELALRGTPPTPTCASCHRFCTAFFRAPAEAHAGR
jgi:MoaA/NifB/PqqE/SkfB family radical SAM enzyme